MSFFMENMLKNRIKSTVFAHMGGGDKEAF